MEEKIILAGDGRLAKLVHGTAKKAGLPPGSLLHVGGIYSEEVKISVAHYNEETLTEKDDVSIDELAGYRQGPVVTWVKVVGLHDAEFIARLGNSFGLHPLVMEDILDTRSRPKLEDYCEYLFIVLKSFVGDGATADLTTEQISLIVGPNYVISFQERPSDLFGPLLDRLRGGKGRLRRMGADYLGYAILDTIVDQYFVVMEALGEQIEDLEESLVAAPGKNALLDVHNLKRKMIYLRKALWPLREVVGALHRGDSELMREGTQVYLRDLYDHIIQVIDMLETYRDIISGMLDIYLSSVSNRMNQIMKVLTVISTIFIPLTFIVGLYGMNFKYMPELEWEWGYPAVWAVMLLVVGGMMRFFRKKQWL